MLTISAGDKSDPQALRGWTTRSGVGFHSTPEQLQQAYRVVRGRLADQWVLWGEGNAAHEPPLRRRPAAPDRDHRLHAVRRLRQNPDMDDAR